MLIWLFALQRATLDSQYEKSVRILTAILGWQPVTS